MDERVSFLFVQMKQSLKKLYYCKFLLLATIVTQLPTAQRVSQNFSKNSLNLVFQALEAAMHRFLKMAYLIFPT